MIVRMCFARASLLAFDRVSAVFTVHKSLGLGHKHIYIYIRLNQSLGEGGGMLKGSQSSRLEFGKLVLDLPPLPKEPARRD